MVVRANPVSIPAEAVNNIGTLREAVRLVSPAYSLVYILVIGVGSFNAGRTAVEGS